MKRPLIEAKFYETYYFSNIIRNILSDQFEFLRNLNDFYGDDKAAYFSESFPKTSALHWFIEHVLLEFITEDTENVDIEKRKKTYAYHLNRISAVALEELRPQILPIEDTLKYHEIEYETFIEWLSVRNKTFMESDGNDVYDYLEEIRYGGPLEELMERTVKEVFFVIFQNRSLLLLFNDMMARQIREAALCNIPKEAVKNFKTDGILKRCHIPSWVQRAVFYRDRGMCVLCKKDLTGTAAIWNMKNFDHIVPLSLGGLNDVSNIQLLCDSCNNEKSDKHIVTSDVYEAWYPEE